MRSAGKKGGLASRGREFSPLFRQVLTARGLVDAGAIEGFLYPEYEGGGCDEGLLPDMAKAVRRIEKAVKTGERVMIFGDYDVDGVTATALLLDALTSFGVRDLAYDLPERTSDGYGLPERVVEKIKQEGIKLLITVDCGSSNGAIVESLRELGVDVIITDHHEVRGEVPAALAVVNPKRADSKYPFRNLSGVGVAFKLVLALQKKLKGLEAGQEKWLLDLVALGTVCDQMELTNENRTYVLYGLKVLEKTRRAGLKALKEVAGVEKVSAFAVGFQLGPRINAAGRLGSPRLALKLLTAKSRSEGMSLAAEVDELNSLRRTLQAEAVELVEQSAGSESEVVFAHKADWHEGVIGIVAAKVVEKYRKPAFVFTGKGVLKGSARSFGDFSVAEAITRAKSWIVKGGGHAGAGGLTIEERHFERFKREVCEFYRSLGLKRQERFFEVRADVETEELACLDEKFLEELELLAPFGEGNPEPVIGLKDVLVLDARQMGQRGEHLRLTVRGRDGVILKLVAFFAPEEWLAVRNGAKIAVLAHLTENVWQGVRSVEGRILEIEGV